MTPTQLSLLTLASTHEALACAVGGAERLANGETRPVCLATSPRAGAVCHTLVGLGLLRELGPSEALVRVRRADGAEWPASTFILTDAGRARLAQHRKAG